VVGEPPAPMSSTPGARISRPTKAEADSREMGIRSRWRSFTPASFWRRYWPCQKNLKTLGSTMTVWGGVFAAHHPPADSLFPSTTLWFFSTSRLSPVDA
jgi:hypothetical protein